MTHGTYTGYTRHGCRCMACTRANREYVRPSHRVGVIPHIKEPLVNEPERRVTGISGMTGSSVNNASGVRVWCRCGNTGYANKWIVGKSRKLDHCAECL